MRLARIAVIAVASVALGCDYAKDLLSSGPEATLDAYLEASVRGDSAAAYGYLSAEDQAARSLSEYKASSGNELAKAVAAKTEYRIAEVQTHGATAIAQVDITIPDVSGMFTDLLGGAFASALGGAKQEEIEEKLAKKYSGADLPTTTKREEFTLVREDGDWRVFLDWGTEQKVSALLAEAQALEESKQVRAALAKYDEVLELDSELVEVQQKRAEAEQEVHAFEAKQAYVGNLSLYDLQAKYYETYLDKRVPGVQFKLKNNGDRTLDKVEVTVYFKDASGSVVAEENFHPVLVTKYSLGDNKPLKPNYIWQLDRGKFYKAEAVPSEWKEGSVSAKITDLAFAD